MTKDTRSYIFHADPYDVKVTPSGKWFVRSYTPGGRKSGDKWQGPYKSAQAVAMVIANSLALRFKDRKTNLEIFHHQARG